MKYITLLAIILISVTACKKDNENFKLNTVTINSYLKKDLPQQHIYIKIIDAADTQQVVSISESYPSNLPLPVTLGLTYSVKQALYKRSCVIQLWGDSTGLLSSQKMNMKLYKIVFPLEMNVRNEQMDVTLSGNWD